MLGSRAKVRIQSAFAASDGSEPEPDIAVVPRRDYRDAHPDRAWLIIEVADSSLNKDRGPKARLYAESGVPEYWVVNLVDRTVEVHRDPQAGAYRHIVSHGLDAKIHLQSFADVVIGVREVIAGSA